MLSARTYSGLFATKINNAEISNIELNNVEISSTGISSYVINVEISSAEIYLTLQKSHSLLVGMT